MELFTGSKNTIGTPNLSEKFVITINTPLIDEIVKNSRPVILRDITNNLNQ